MTAVNSPVPFKKHAGPAMIPRKQQVVRRENRLPPNPNIPPTLFCNWLHLCVDHENPPLGLFRLAIFGGM